MEIYKEHFSIQVLIGLQDLLNLGYSESDIQRTEKYNLRSSSELVTDCILGRIQLKMFVISKTDSQSQELHFGHTKVNLLV